MTDSPGLLFDRLVEIMARLRGPGGCPWDREQTRASLKGYLIEEAYEVVEALEGGDRLHLQEELGDLLFQVLFHAQIAAEQGEFAIADVLRRLSEKMVRRHPHVFGGPAVGSAQEALAQWEALKQHEAASQGHLRSVIDGVPRALPALLRAQRVQTKAARIRFDWPDARAAWAKVQEEIREAATALASGDRERLTEELGDVLFSLVNVARLSEIDAEEALGRAIEKFRRRFTDMEQELRAGGQSVDSVPPEELERAWEAVKAQERARAKDPGPREASA
jgi:MazG family protein